MTVLDSSLGSPFAESIRLDDLWRDPYPIYRRLRAEGPIAWVPAANRYMVIGHAEVTALEKQPRTFSADEQNSLMHRAMGHTMLRKDGAVHRRERKAAEPALHPRMIKDHWHPLFQRIADQLVDGFVEHGQADLLTEFAQPLAAQSLAAVMGLTHCSPADLVNWAQAMMDGTGNYGDDPVVWARCETARDAAGKAIDEAARRLRAEPDPSVISSMVNAPDPLSPEEIRANARLFISGGLSEPRDATATATHALLTHPEQRAAVEADPDRFADVFDESVRWVSPISMYPRMTTIETELGGVHMPAGARIGVMVGAANRDESVFPEPDEFDIDRTSRPIWHSAGDRTPVSARGWPERKSAQVALPTLFRRLPNLRPDTRTPVRMGGWVFRGVLNLPVRWDI